MLINENQALFHMGQTTLFVLLIFFSLFGLNAQDIQFSQFYAVDLYQNPAFTGASHHKRVMFHQRIQWPKLQAKYLTSFASYDQYFEKYNSGAGISVMHDKQADNVLKSTNIGFYYAYELILSSTYSLRAGMQVDAVSRNVNYGDLRFSSQYNNNGYQGGQPTTNLDSYNQQINYADISTGLLFYNNNLWAGLSFHHLNEPNQSLTSEEANLPLKTSITAGYKIVLQKENHGLYSYSDDFRGFSLTPTVHYKAQNNADQVDAGLYANLKHFIAAIWYRGIPFKRINNAIDNNESMVFIVGYKANNFGINYSYDLVVSSLNKVATGGAHEIHFNYLIGKFKRSIKPTKKAPCPKFYTH